MHDAIGRTVVFDYVNQYAPMVRRMAYHLMARLPASVQMDDMVQAGMIGLMDAASRYKDDQGANFETFANPRIRGAMLDELRSSDWIPRGVRRAQRRIEKATCALEQRLGRAASEPEIAEALGLSLAEYHQLANEAKGAQIFYYDEASGDDAGAAAGESALPPSHADPLGKLHDKRFREALAAAIGELPEREKNLMGLYYEKDLNFREIAAVFSVTESRVCQLHTRAVSRLREKLGGW
jgi:RNA polymerase sigma factor for flagellar operon FliA